MKCPYCNSDLPENSRFCNACGQEIAIQRNYSQFLMNYWASYQAKTHLDEIIVTPENENTSKDQYKIKPVPSQPIRWIASAILTLIIIVPIMCIAMNQNANNDSILSEGESLTADSDSTGASDIIQSGMAGSSTSEDMQEKAEGNTQERIAAAIAEADSLAITGDYAHAFEIINTYLADFPESEDLQKKSEEYSQAWIAATVAEADSLAADENYQSALELIHTLLKTFPKSETLREKNQDYTTKQVTKRNLSICKTYSGTYLGNSRRGFDLEILSCNDAGHINAVFFFYGINDTEKVYGSYQMEGDIQDVLDDGSIVASLVGTKWIEQPESWYMIDFVVTINADRTKLTSEDYDISAVEKKPGNYSNLITTYSGTYQPSWGITGLDITILSCNDNTGQIRAEVFFYRLEQNPNARTGRFTMNGRIVETHSDGAVKVDLVADEWIEKPENTIMLNFALTTNAARDQASCDDYRINLRAVNNSTQIDNNLQNPAPICSWDFSKDLTEQTGLPTTVHGDTKIITGLSGRVAAAAYFDGDGDYIECGRGLNLTEDYTFHIRLNCQDVDKKYSAFFAKFEENDAPYAFSFHYGRVNLWISAIDGSELEIESTDKLQNDRWYDITVVKNGNHFKLYIDGQLDSEGIAPSIVTDDSLVTIGRQALLFEPEDQLQFKGYIAQISIYDQALSGEEIVTLCNK